MKRAILINYVRCTGPWLILKRLNIFVSLVKTCSYSNRNNNFDIELFLDLWSNLEFKFSPIVIRRKKSNEFKCGSTFLKNGYFYSICTVFTFWTNIIYFFMFSNVTNIFQLKKPAHFCGRFNTKNVHKIRSGMQISATVMSCIWKTTFPRYRTSTVEWKICIVCWQLQIHTYIY